jgi:5'-3' exonuclease
MGIKNLNQYLLKTCSKNSIQKMYFENIQRKTIVVDISIYLYKFLMDGNYMEHLYTMLSIFKYYIITPIFIFDGKPPPEKWDLIKKRNWEKKDAELKLITMQMDLSNNESITKEEMMEMDELRKKSLRIKSEDIVKTKELIDAFGFIYYDAPGEADQLCAYFVKKEIAWACLSDDMDMFLYGCTRVLRNLSLMNRSFMFYDSVQILNELQLNYHDFLEIAVLCGTDYNSGYISLYKTIELYNEYKKSNDSDTFYNWFIQKSHLNETMDFTTICSMFDLSNQGIVLDPFSESFKNDLFTKKANIQKIKDIMSQHGFIFI